MSDSRKRGVDKYSTINLTHGDCLFEKPLGCLDYLKMSLDVVSCSQMDKNVSSLEVHTI
jgi:hypothetical protein